jgi:hypothetical protein
VETLRSGIVASFLLEKSDLDGIGVLYARRVIEGVRRFIFGLPGILFGENIRVLLGAGLISLHNYCEKFTWLCANRICWDANPFYSGSDVGERAI